MAHRLLIVSDSLCGGLGSAVTSHAAWFGQKGWEVAVAAPGGEDGGMTVSGHVPVPIPLTARDVAGMADAASGIRQVRRRFGPDVVHCHGGRAFLATRVSGGGRPHVTLHGVNAVESDPWGYRYARRLGLAALPPLANSAFTALPDSPWGWRFVPHASDRLSLLEPLGPPAADRPTILWVGRLDEPKRPDLFVRAMAALHHHVPDATGLMAGTGPLREQIADMVAGLDAPVELLGHRTDVPDLLRKAWVVALLSDGEAVSFSVQEAMWAGRPVVASDLPGIRWLVGDDRRAGALVGNAAGEVVAAFRRLCDPAAARAAGEGAAGRIRERLHPGDPWPAVERAYQR